MRNEDTENSLMKLFCLKTHVHLAAFQEDATSRMLWKSCLGWSAHKLDRLIL